MPTPLREPATVGRLAPSPTGRLHVGHARTFLLAFWQARSKNGRIVMRLEDLDGPRVRPGMSEAILSDLEWLGIEWDGAPLVQSHGIDSIRAAAHELLERGLAYGCVCTRGDLRSAQSAPQAGDAEPRYPGTCRDRFPSLAAARADREAGLRFRVPEGELEIADGVAGQRRFDVQAEVGDFLIARRDGAPAYQLAVVVDDARQGVTEVVRGDDLLPSAARQWHLQRALGLPHPAWFHVSLVVDEQGRRLAKRADDVSLAELRERGVDPRAIVGWAARSSDQDVPDRVTAAEVTRVFELARLSREPVTLGAADIAEIRAAR